MSIVRTFVDAKAGIDGEQASEAAEDQARADEQDDRERDFADDEG